ncbi:hypothetical protein [Actinomadura sp. WMMA1423]|uniref:hypothetical protein n=1 Tax=Actinomadura sp. WMMA1423 TaxID=2591108 RepID=UPI00114728B7|nr:hypothetical protein [Actinomadura sp. WMMA1423]
MAIPKATEREYADALRRFNLYDRHVDVVSAFEWLFTSPNVRDVPDTVLHFERYPRIKVSSQRTLTPDFTVLFRDGSGLAGEIAEIALHDNSVNKLCKQLASYDALDRIPTRGGKLAETTHLDVMLFVSLRIGVSAVERVITERYLEESHEYKPSYPPIIVQYARDDQVYSFQRLHHKDNGHLREGDRTPKIQPRLEKSLNISATHFIGVKAARSFINDTVDPLYLATHLWTKVWPSKYGHADNRVIEINVQETVDDLRRHHGPVKSADVKAALEILNRAALAQCDSESRIWRVAWGRIMRTGEPDVHKVIARRAFTDHKPRIPRQLRGNFSEQRPTAQESLF